MRAEIEIGESRLSLVEGDITRQAVDAIVNAANRGLRGGGGVDGAIHSAGGPAIMAECRLAGSCPTGDAVATGAGRLPARWVVHAVGPVYSGGTHGEPLLLASAYRRSLDVAVGLGARTVAFPSLSTGAYGYPVELAAPIALRTVAEFLSTRPGTLAEIRFVLFGAAAYGAFEAALATIHGKDK